ncbi:succinate dehydrogenase cytochrome b subunit [Actinoallomurus purpureus]|uniref:succinate dehydrogenase cytochrome b subunit n=1 Tax=Actinoallomurus purpureus TaxID=478114 RepID=UPI0020934B4B|nr:succinate dehydrogenase cytochrome b subunit [Actinoallomurus purpureus]MCO6006605.1 succinate dehydrogenase cytochrome b subunit [Actinoallomurus purpureus]
MTRSTPVATRPRPKTPSSAAGPLKRYRSSVGRKVVMAVTGAILFLFVITHMLGDLKAFLGREDFNHYSYWLRSVGAPALPHRVFLSSLEAGLVVAVILHIWAAVSLARQARRARPVRYAARPKVHENGYATYVMRYGGVVILLFVIWHLLDLTFGAVNPKGENATPYDKVIADFDPARWYITLFYIVAVILVGLHLRHGLFSAVQTLGWGRQGRYPAIRLVADVTAALVVLGFVAVPVGVTIGVLK